jgi:hypothetical protein
MTELRHHAITDPFDLPEWLGSGELTWVAASGLASASLSGALVGQDGERLPLSIIAADRAYPTPVVDEEVRRAVHQAWALNQVVILDDDGCQTLAVPTVTLDTELVCEAMRRFARAIGVDTSRVSLTIRL